MSRVYLSLLTASIFLALSNGKILIEGPRIEDYYAIHPLVSECPCPSPELCLPLETASLIKSPHTHLYQAKKNKPEVFAFVLNCSRSEWETFDWVKLTTIAIFNFADDDITCYAHQHGVKVVKMSNLPVSSLPNATARQEFTQAEVTAMLEQSLDGLNLDFEGPVEDGSEEQAGYTSLVQEMTDAIHAALPGGQMSVDVAWSSNGIDGRNYDYAAVGKAADLLFIMAYDEMSQIWDEPCSARANSGLEMAMEGVESYLSLGIPKNKLVLGLPWYGYRYTCIQYFQNNNTCVIEKVEFQGAPCSDAAGRQFTYAYIKNLMNEKNITQVWENDTATPYYNYEDPSVSDGTIQMRYDNPHSLKIKIDYAMNLGLLGAGMWNANSLDPSDSAYAILQRAEMWGVMP